MTNTNRKLISGICLSVTVLAWASCRNKSPDGKPVVLGGGNLQITLGSGNGLPVAIESRVAGRERAWMSGPAQLTVSRKVDGIRDFVKLCRVHSGKDGVDVSSDMEGLGLKLSHRLTISGGKAVWEMTFSGNEKRTEHEVSLDLPILFPKARVFVPSQYGVMDVDAYPSFKPEAYARFSWEDKQTHILPLVSVMDPETDNAVTIALPVDENIPHLQVAWSDSRNLVLKMGRRGMGGGRPTTIRILLYVHPADYRSALKVYSDDFPAYFRPVLPRGPYEGTFWYHHILSHPDFEEMARQNVRFVWSSFWFTRMGDFMPSAKEWYPYTYSRWWKLKETMSDEKIAAFIKTMHEHDIGTYAYFNVTEYGGAGDKDGGTEAPDRELTGPLAAALVRNPDGKAIPTWEGSKVVNPGPASPYRQMLMDQARRHVQRIPEFDGFIVDRLDWASGFDYSRDDGLSMDGDRPMENMAVPVADALGELNRIAHEAGKRVILNQFWRADVLRDADGYCHENDYLPAMAYVAPFRPASAWHRRSYSGDLLPFEAQMKRRLFWALFPQFVAHEFPVSQQDPNPRAADLMEIYAPLFAPLIGKEQVLEPHCVAVTGPNDTNLFFNGQRQYVAPVVSRVKFMSRPTGTTEAADLTLRVAGAAGLSWAHVYSADGPPYRAQVEMADGAARVRLEKHGSSSMVVVGRAPEPPLDSSASERLAGIRAKLFPATAGPGKSVERPVVRDVEGIEIEVSGTSVGASYPVTAVGVFVGGRKVGEIRDAASRFHAILPMAVLPANPPVVGLVPGDEGTWLAPERVNLIVRTKGGAAWRAASWEYGDNCGAEGIRGISLPLSWRTLAPLEKAAARFVAKDLRTGGLWQGKIGRTASWMPGVREGEAQSGFSMRISKGRGRDWTYSSHEDARVLRDSSEPVPAAAGRATCWFGQDQTEIRIDPPGKGSYRLTVYLLDYDRAGRAGKISVSNGDKVLDEKVISVEDAQGGVYISWDVSGPITIRSVKEAGPDALISGVFIDRK
jgi:hypothetical protein